MAFYTTSMTNGFFEVARSFWSGCFKIFLFREFGLLIRPRRFLIKKLPTFKKGFPMAFGFVIFFVRSRRALTITIFGGGSFKRVIIELLTETTKFSLRLPKLLF